jgi:hypothetical protein
MIVRTSGKGDLAIINLRMLRTDSLEESADPFGCGSTFAEIGARDRVSDFIAGTLDLERSIGNHNGLARRRDQIQRTFEILQRSPPAPASHFFESRRSALL